jgi:hypothetical protein
MGVNFGDFDPIPHLTSPLKGEEPVTLPLEGGGTGYVSAYGLPPE